MSSNSEEYPEKLNLDNCSREPIHLIGQTQAHGVLVVCDADFKITQIGENATQFFGVGFDELLGKDLSYLLGKEQFKEFGGLQESKELSIPQDVLINDTNFLMLGHLSGPNLILDFEPYHKVESPFFFQKTVNPNTKQVPGFQICGSTM